MLSSTPALTPTPAPSSRLQTSDDESSSVTVDTTKRKRASYVWNHFSKVKGKTDKRGDGRNRCEVVDPKTGRVCGTMMKEDATGSTRSMAAHLKGKHNITEDGPVKKNSTVIGYFKKGKISGEVIVFHLISFSFSFSFVYLIPFF